jgi:hypothetical protein
MVNATKPLALCATSRRTVSLGGSFVYMGFGPKSGG